MTKSATDEELRRVQAGLREALDIAKTLIKQNEELSEVCDAARPLFEEYLARCEQAENYSKLAESLGGRDRFESLKEDLRKFLARRDLNKDAAKMPRRDLLSRELANMLDSQPAISNDDVLAELSRMADARIDPIESVSDDEIEWIDKQGRIQATSITALKKRITRLRESLPAD